MTHDGSCFHLLGIFCVAPKQRNRLSFTSELCRDLADFLMSATPSTDLFIAPVLRQSS